ncbi:MAG TPA: MFS transporter [Pilimelia sp.]|nr:MFS transporter [Pilimelia sp.]
MTRVAPPLARPAVAAFFFSLGLGFGSWAVRIPDIQCQLGLGSGALGAALLAIPVGSLVGMPLVGWWCGRSHSARVLRLSGVLFAASVALPAWVGTLGGLAAALAVLGFGNGALGVAMNVQGSLLERRIGRSIMSSFHGVFSLGGMIGALGGGAMDSTGMTARVHLSAVAGVLVTLAAVAGLGVKTAPADGGRPTRSLALHSRRVLAGGVGAFCVLFGEGAVTDWSAIYLKSELRAETLAGAGYAAFAGAMALGRFGGDRLAARLGAHRLVVLGGWLGAAGITVGVLVPEPAVVVAGLGLMGAGLSVIYPQIVSAAGRAPDVSPDAAIASVSTVGYLGFLVGPPVIGGLAEFGSLRVALLLVAAGIIAVVPLAGVATREVPAGSQQPSP